MASPVELREQLNAERGGIPYLVYRDGDDAQRILILSDATASVTIGRGTGCDVCLAWDDQVSRAHAELVRIGDDWAIVDDGLSRNGTFVNGARVMQRRRLRDRDVLKIGATRIDFRAPSQRFESTAASGVLPCPELSPAQRRVLVALCRPYRSGAAYPTPASNRQIADELVLGLETVRSHLRALFEAFDVEELPRNRKRARLVELAFQTGAVTPRELEG